MTVSETNWYLYILQCNDNSFYTGVTKDLRSRVERHNLGQGAKYTRSRRPVKLIYYEEHVTESDVKRREFEIKGWRREKKERLVRGFPSKRLGNALRISGQ
jgi:putative endonuclease